MQLTAPRNRAYCSLLLVVTILCGLGSRRFAAEVPRLVAENAGDCLWTVAAYLAICLAFPSWPSARVFSFSITLSFFVEFSQLLDWPILAMARQTRLGRLFLGSGFLWIDLLRYVGGGTTAFLIDLQIARSKSEWNEAGP